MNRKSLLETLELVGRALAADAMVPIFQCFCFHGETVSSYNDSLGLIAPCKTDDGFAVNGNTLLGLLRNTQSEEVEFSLVDQDCVIKAGRSTFKLPWFPKEDFLFEEPTDKWHSVLALDEEMLKGFDACLLTSSKDNSQPALMGVFLNGVQHTLYSCDGDALSRYTIAESQHCASAAMLPNAFCEAVLKVAENFDIKDVQTELSVNLGWAKADIGDHVVYGRLIENEKPLDHAGLITKTIKGKPSYVPLPKGLDNALSRARVIADAESAKTVLTVASGRLKLVTETHAGIVRDTLPLPDHPEVEAHVNAELTQRSIKQCDEMAILDNAVAYRLGTTLFVLLSNMG